MRLFVLFSIMMLLSGLIYSCPVGHSEIVVPAVISKDAGDLVTINIDIVEGNGNIYMEIDPLTGMSTQQSSRHAVNAGFDYMNETWDDCDIYFDVEGLDNSDYVDGPSAGASLTLGILSTIKNETIRNDAIITGTINDDKEIGGVGGLVEKSKATDTLGYKYLITPVQGVKDNMLASVLEDRYGIKIIHIENLSELAPMVFTNEAINVSREPNLRETDLPDNLSNYDVKGLEDFEQITVSMLAEFDSQIEAEMKIQNEQSNVYPFIKYFDSEIEVQQQLIDKGYYYTAANNIFGMAIDYRFLNSLVANKNATQTLNSVDDCLNSYDLKTKKTDNWQWVAGATMRKYWAKKRMRDNENMIDKVKTDEEEYQLMYSLLQGRAWCGVSQYLNVEGVGQEIDESKIEDYAKDRLKTVNYMFLNSPSPNSEAKWHLSLAEEQFQDDEYISAIYETCYVESIQKSHQYSLSEEDRVLYNPLYGPKSKWGKLYHAQGKYLSTTGQDDNMLYLLAECMDATTLEIDERLAQEVNEQENKKDLLDPEITNNEYDIYRILLILESIILILLVIKMKRQSN